MSCYKVIVFVTLLGCVWTMPVKRNSDDTENTELLRDSRKSMFFSKAVMVSTLSSCEMT